MDNQKRAYFIGGLAFCVVVAIILWFICAGRSTVHDLRNRSDDIRNELSNAESEQRKKDRLLIEQEKQLNEAEMKSAKAENELQIANEQIKKLKKSNEVTENSLKKTRELFNEYEKETERKIRIKTRQRNMWIAATVVAVGAAISRR